MTMPDPIEAPVPEAEILLPLTCPVCGRQALSGFRMTVVVEAVLSGQIRLYSTCHLAAWDASVRELDALFDYLDTAGAETGEQKLVFVNTGLHDLRRSSSGPESRTVEGVRQGG
jgi:hypothetical protein